MDYKRNNVVVFSVLNCVRLLTRVLPYIFEDPDWRGFFWSTLPGQAEETEVGTIDIFTHAIHILNYNEIYLINSKRVFIIFCMLV